MTYCRSARFSLVVLSFLLAGAAGAATLPAGYTELEYIQGDGKGRVKTDYYPNPQTDKIEAVVEFTDVANAGTVWCARYTSATDQTWSFFQLAGGKLRFDYSSTKGPEDDSAPVVQTGVKYTLTVDRNVFTWSGGEGYSHTAVSTFTKTTNFLVLFGAYASNWGYGYLGTYGKHRLYAFRVFRNGVLIHDYVPAKDPDGTVVLFDTAATPSTLVNEYGTFIAGPDKTGLDIATLPSQNWYLKGVVEPRPSVTYIDPTTGERTVLVEGTDYTLSWSDNGALGTGKVTVTGKGAYAGQSSEAYFPIVCGYGNGTILYVAPDGTSDADCLSWATAGTLSNACARATSGTSAARTIILLKSGTADKPAVYDYSEAAVSGPAYNLASLGTKNYITITSEGANPSPTNCVIRGPGKSREMRCLYNYNSNAYDGTQVWLKGLTFEGFARTGQVSAGDSTSGGMGAALYVTARTHVTNCIFRANFGTNIGACHGGNYYDCAFLFNTNTAKSGWHNAGSAVSQAKVCRNCFFFGNQSAYAALQFAYKDAESYADSCLFVSNTGSRACQAYSLSSAWITNCTFFGNCAGAAENLKCYDCKFIDNRSAQNTSGDVTGTAGANNCKTYDCLFKDNAVTGNGAAAHVRNGAHYRDIFEGGAVSGESYSYFFGGANNTSDGAKYYDCIFRNAKWTGYIFYRAMTLERCVFSNLTMSATIAPDNYGVAMNRCVFTDIETSTGLLNLPSKYPVYNCLVVSNRQTGATTTPLITYSDLRNWTVADNVCGEKSGRAVGFWNKSQDCIFYGNTPYDVSATTDGGNYTYLTNCVVGAANGLPRGKDTRQLAHSPFVRSPDARHPYGCQLRRSSGCVDAGSCSDIYAADALDLAGTNRVMGAAVDLGCYEWYTSGLGFSVIVR